MEKVYRDVILAMAENDMKIAAVARAMHYHRNSLIYHLEKIEKLYHLDPTNFYDLCKLLEMVKEDEHGQAD